MSKISLSFILILSLTGSCNRPDKELQGEVSLRLEQLDITEGNYPRAFFFRQPEGVYDPYDLWDQNFRRLMGIIGKAVPEERSFTALQNNPEYFTRFKKNHPEQMVLIHYSGLARQPSFRPVFDRFFAGHWLYYGGVSILSDVPAEEGITKIKVSDASQFFLDVGIRNVVVNDHIGLCALDGNGKPDWQWSEQVTLVDVDYENDIISVRRGQFGTTPKAFTAEKANAAVHCAAGPWGDEMCWAYNFSTKCPKDANGNTCVDLLVDDLAFRFSPEGELAAFDGIEFDIIFWDIFLLNPRNPDLGPVGVNRSMDADADGVADGGIVESRNIYGLGTYEFLKRLREQLGPDRIIMADGTKSIHQRAFGILNGIESEGWPNGHDIEFEEWSDGVNRMQFWNANAMEPVLGYMNHNYWGGIGSGDIGTNQLRLVIAASTLTGSAYGLFEHPETFFGGKIVSKRQAPFMNGEEIPFMMIYDELVMGKANKPGWLGKPLGETRLLANEVTPQLYASDRSEWEFLARKIRGGVDMKGGDDGLLISSKDGEKGNMKMIIENVRVKGPYLTIFITAEAEPMTGYPEEIARLMWVRIPHVKSDTDRHMAWVNRKPFESAFVFREIGSDTIDIEIEVESRESIRIREFGAYCAGDIRTREFENGVVLANPKSEPVQIDLTDLFPGRSFRRIEGTPEQDTVTNNGLPVTESVVTLSKWDALFLIKEK
jgi:hypothetical protein